MCNCLKDGEFKLFETDKGDDIYLDLKTKEVNFYDYREEDSYALLKINYCPICGKKL